MLSRLQNIVQLYVNSVISGRPMLTLSKYHNTEAKHIAQYLALVLTIMQNITERRTLNIRSFYYQYKDLFDSQRQSNYVIQNLQDRLGVSRSELMFTATSRGLFFCNCQVVYNNEIRQIDSATPITEELIQASQFETDAVFCLVVEKETIFNFILQNYAHLC